MDRYLTFEESQKEIIDLLAERRFILGIDRVVITSDGTEPDINSIADFSAAFERGDIEKNIDDARRFLASFGQNRDERFIFTIA